MARKPSTTAELVSLMVIIGRCLRDSKGKSKNVSPGSFLQFITVRYIDEAGKPLMSDVARYFNITPPAATLLVDGLVRQKLIVRIFDSHDRRAVRLAVTSPGRKLLDYGIKGMAGQLRKIFSVLSATEQKQLLGILRKMVDASREK